MTRYILTNFGCGNGPFLRTVDYAMRIRALLGKRGESIRILVPEVYGEKMAKLIREDYAEAWDAQPNLFLFDRALGRLLSRVLYDGGDFGANIAILANTLPEVQALVDAHLAKPFDVHTEQGEAVRVSPDEIMCSVSRNPVVGMGNVPSYYSSIGYLEKILRYTEASPFFRYDAALLRKAADHAGNMERRQLAWFMPEISAFSYEEGMRPWVPGEEVVPPLFTFPSPVGDALALEPGIYVLVSGIPQLGRLYKEVQKLGLLLYTNQAVKEFPASNVLHPKYITHPSIIGVYARAAWNTIWLANLAKKPLVCPEFLPDDFSEIYFNNKTVETLGLGTVMQAGMASEEAFAVSRQLLPSIEARYERIRLRHGTLDGVDVLAARVVKSLEQRGLI